MATRHTDERADRIVCDLYRRFLDRQPDAEGYRYVRESLTSGEKSLREHILEVVNSDEFHRKFVKARPREKVVQHLYSILLGRTLSDPYKLARQVADLALLDLGPYTERLVSSADYQRRYGEDRLPGGADGMSSSEQPRLCQR